MLRPIAALAALALSAAAFAQVSITISSTSQQVEALAPQLVPFAGSLANFDSLVNGLTAGAPVTLTTVNADGSVQIVTFTPGTTLSTLDAARALETARQNLIVRGVALPTAQQLAIALIGGRLVTVSGVTPLPGVLTGTTTATTPIQVRNELASAQTLATTPVLSLSLANSVALRSALERGTSATLALTTDAGATQTVIFPAVGGPMTPLEVNQALQLASALLAQQGILNPTPDQIRAALVGGTVVSASGTPVPLQGVLQGRVVSTSASPAVPTSASPLVGTSTSPNLSTSNSQVLGTSNSPATTTPVMTPAPLAPVTAPRITVRPRG
jgi:hypothetical protein